MFMCQGKAEELMPFNPTFSSEIGSEITGHSHKDKGMPWEGWREAEWGPVPRPQHTSGDFMQTLWNHLLLAEGRLMTL